MLSNQFWQAVPLVVEIAAAVGAIVWSVQRSLAARQTARAQAPRAGKRR